MTKFRKIFYTVGVTVIILLVLFLIREIFILKLPGETKTLWQRWTSKEPTIEELYKAWRKAEDELEELKKVRRKLEELRKEREKR